MLGHDSGGGDFHGMKTRAVKSGRKPAAPRLRLKSHRAQTVRRGELDEPKLSRPRSRTAALQLAAEVDALAAQLEASRARIIDLEARVDIDPLTDILNRRGFERELKRSLAYVKRYGTSAALVFIDLDGFKPVNDRHGHAAGDAVLKAIAAALTGSVRASDVAARPRRRIRGAAVERQRTGRRGQGRGAGSGRSWNAGALEEFNACRRRLRGRRAAGRARHAGRGVGAR
jgi:hypothetical protein